MSPAGAFESFLKELILHIKAKAKQYKQRVLEKFLCKQTPKIQNKYKSTDGMLITPYLISNMN